MQSKLVSVSARRALRHARAPRYTIKKSPYSTSAATAEQVEQQQQPTGLRGLWARSKQLARQHGRIYTATYLGLSAIDFSFVFAVILMGGADQVRAAEDYVLEHLDWRRGNGEDGKLKEKVGDWAQRHRQSSPKQRTEQVDLHRDQTEEHSRKGEYGSALWTSAALAYAIHKTLFLPFRLGATFAITPWVVRTLRKRGWNVGAPTTAATAASATS